MAINFKPGQKFSYSGKATATVSSVITHLTGRGDSNRCGNYESGILVLPEVMDIIGGLCAQFS
jgi:hypothetical protein